MSTITEPRRRFEVSFASVPSKPSLYPTISGDNSIQIEECKDRSDNIKVEYISLRSQHDLLTAYVQTEGAYVTAKSSRRKQLRDVAILQQETVVNAGDVVFLVSRGWWNMWVQNIDKDIDESDEAADIPPPIDNWPIIDTGKDLNAQLQRQLHLQTKSSSSTVISRYQYNRCKYVLNKGMNEHDHYVVVNRETWSALHWWFGGGPPLPRFVVGAADSIPMHHDLPHNSLFDYLASESVERVSALRSRLLESLELSLSRKIVIDANPSQPPSILEAFNHHGSSIHGDANSDIEVDVAATTDYLHDSSSPSKRSRVYSNDHQAVSNPNQTATLDFKKMNFNDCGYSLWSAAVNQTHENVGQNPMKRPTNSCFACRRVATFRCCECKAVHYCSRLCQEVCFKEIKLKF